MLQLPELSANFHRATYAEEGAGLLVPTKSGDVGGVLPREGFSYSGLGTIGLPGPDSSSTLNRLLFERRSVREFRSEAITLKILGQLCFAAAGVTGTRKAFDGSLIKQRTAPSAGALYPMELYVCCNRVESVAAGLYHYDPKVHSLGRVRKRAVAAEFDLACCGQGHSQAAAVTFVFVADFGRNQDKYGARGYRYVFLDVGHAAQNLCLSAAELRLACFTSCGFFDDQLSRLLRLDGLQQAPLYLAYAGLPA